jgi:hypothetical protein
MSILGSILEKLGIKKPAAPAAPAASPATPPVYIPGHLGSHGEMSQASPYATEKLGAQPPSVVQSAAPAPSSVPAPVKPAEMAMVDVVSHLDFLAKTGPIQGLNWRMSINDLMALLGLDHSPQAIRDLAVELGCPEKEMADSYSRNVWTHTTLLKKIAENGGNIPPELLK